MKKIFSILILAVATILSASATQVVKVVYSGNYQSITFRTNNVSATRIYYARSTNASPSFNYNVTPTNSGNYSTFSISSTTQKTIQIQLDDAVTFFEISANQTNATSVTLSSATNLASVCLKGCTSLTTLTLGTMSALTDIDVSNTSAAVANAITAANCPNLENLNVANCGLTSLGYTGTGLYSLDITGNSITTLNVSSYSKLDMLRCESNTMTSLTLPSSVTTVSAQSNNLTGVTGYGEPLAILDVASNNISSLTVSDAVNLTDLDISSNHLTFRSFPSATYKPARMRYTGNDGKYDLSGQMRAAFGSYSYPLVSMLPNYAARNETTYTLDMTDCRLDGNGEQNVVPVINSYNGTTDTPLALSSSDVDGNDYAKSNDGNYYGFMKQQSRVRFSFTDATYPGLTLYSNEFTVPNGVKGTLQIVDEDGTELYTINNAVFSDAIDGLPADARRDYTQYTYPETPATAGQTWRITAGPSADAPFAWANIYEEAVWYYLGLKDKYVTAGEQLYELGGAPAYNGHKLKDTYDTSDNNYQWAFVGNQYTGFKIYNKGRGSGQTLQDYSGYWAPTTDGLFPVMKSGESLTWIVRTNSSGTGFSLENKSGGTDNVNGGVSAPCFLNDYEGRGAMNYWITSVYDAQNDAGSLFNVIKASEPEIADIKIIYGDNDETTYGSWDSGSKVTWTSNDASGMAGMTLTKSAGSFGNYNSITGYKDLYYYLGSGTATLTLTAPEGYVITGYSAKLRQGQNKAASYTVTTADGQSFSPAFALAINNCTDMTVSGLSTNSTDITISNTDNSCVLDFLNFVVSVSLAPPSDVKICYGENLNTYYGSWSGSTWTSNDDSGMAGLTLAKSGGSFYNYSNVTGYKDMSYYTGGTETLTLTAPTGYVITGYSAKLRQANGSESSYTLTTAGGETFTPPVATAIGGYMDMVVSDVNTNSTTLTIANSNASNVMGFVNFVVQLAREGREEISIYWNVRDSEGNTKLTVTKKYPSNSTIDAYPDELTAYNNRFVSYPTLTPFTAVTQRRNVTYTWTGPFQISTTGDEHHYNLKMRNARYLSSDTNSDGVLSMPDTAPATTDDGYRWMFFGDPFNGFTIRCYAKGSQELAAANGTDTNGTSWPTFASEGQGTKWIVTSATRSGYTEPFSISPANTSGVYWNQYSYWIGGTLSYGLKYWTQDGTGDAGACIEAVELPDPSAVYITWNILDAAGVIRTTIVEAYSKDATVSEYPASMTAYEDRFVEYPTLTSFTADRSKSVDVTYSWTGPFQLTTDTDNPHLYFFKSARYRYYAYAPNSSTGQAKQASMTKNAVTPRSRWFFTGDPFNGIEIRPYVYPETGLINNTLSTTPTKYIPKANPGITTDYWNTALPSAAISFLIPGTSNCLSEELGTWSAASVGTDKGLNFVVEDGSDLSMLVGTGYYRVRCMGDGLTSKYWKLDEQGGEMKLWNDGDSTDMSSVFRVEEQINSSNNMPTYNIAGFYNGEAWYLDNTRTSYSQQFTATQTPENYMPAEIIYNSKSGETPFFAIKLSNQESYSGYSYANTNGNTTQVVTYNYTSGTADGSAWTFESVELPSRAVENTYYTTAYLPFDYTLPEGVTAYTITISGTGAAVPHELTGGVPAGTGVLLVGDGISDMPIEYKGYSLTSDDESNVSGNALRGTYEAIATPANTYVFSGKNGKPGFYKYSGATLSAYKAYLPSTNSNARGFELNFDDDGNLTGITVIEEEGGDTSNGAIFDLQGRRVAQPQKGGIYIINGKKVYVR